MIWEPKNIEAHIIDIPQGNEMIVNICTWAMPQLVSQQIKGTFQMIIVILFNSCCAGCCVSGYCGGLDGALVQTKPEAEIRN